MNLKLLRREANIRNPPSLQAADALSLKDLLNIWDKSEQQRVDPSERQALEILTVAFATTSRVAEITALKIRDVAEDGSSISIRAKTYAQTCVKHMKHVGSGCGLYPTRILRERRARAILQGRTLLFSSREDKDAAITSSEVTAALKRLTRKLQLKCRVTAHSGRKGAAVTALLAGIPVVVIQAFGLWKGVESLQAYLGKAVRERFCILDLVTSK